MRKFDRPWTWRHIVVIPIIGGAALFLWLGVVVIFRVFDDYKDVEDLVYVLVGSLFIAVGVILLLTTVLAFSGDRGAKMWLPLAVVTTFAAVLPYTELVGTFGVVLHAIFGVVALWSWISYLRPPQRTA